MDTMEGSWSLVVFSIAPYIIHVLFAILEIHIYIYIYIS